MFCQLLGLFMAVFVLLLSGNCLAGCPGGTMPNGFCWPTEGNDLLLGWHGSNPDYPEKSHLGQDIRAAEGKGVFAIADGVVLYNRMDVGGFGGYGFDGGGLIIKHKLSSGEEFTALYAHLKNISVGATVKKGQKIAEIGPYIGGTTHLHLGIRFPYNDDGNRWAGYGSDDSGFTNPLNFINNYTPNNWLSVVYYPYFRAGNLAWFPGDVSCINADQWIYFNLGYPNGGMSIGDSNICYEHESEVYFNVDLNSYAFQILYGSGNINQYKVCQQ